MRSRPACVQSVTPVRSCSALCVADYRSLIMTGFPKPETLTGRLFVILLASTLGVFMTIFLLLNVIKF